MGCRTRVGICLGLACREVSVCSCASVLILALSLSAHALAAPLSFEAWQALHFSTQQLSRPEIAGPAADPENDALPNLLEYGLGASPWIVDAADFSPVPVLHEQEGTSHLAISFLRNPASTGVKFALEAADDLAGEWSAVNPLLPANQVSVETVGAPAGLQRIVARDPGQSETSPRRFLRLRATLAPPAAAPEISPPGGSFGGATVVSLTTASVGASIRYTLNGDAPTATTGILYTGPFTLASSATVNAIAYADHLADSPPATTVYTLSTGGSQTPALPAYKTTALKGTGDVADDTAIWLHPTSLAQSVIIGVSKSSTSGSGGLYAFNLTGTRQGGASSWTSNVNWFSGSKKYNNVDITHGFPAGGQSWDLVCASNRTDRRIDVYRVLTNTAGAFAGLDPVGRIEIGTGFASGTDAAYGCAVYHRRENGLFHVFTSDKNGVMGQYALRFDPAGTGTARILGTRVAQWDVTAGDTEVEGIVADDYLNVLYIAAEDEAIYRYSTDALGVVQTQARTTVDTAGNARLTADIEGLTLYYAAHGTGYLIASSQGSDSYAVYNRAFAPGAANRYVKNFTIGANGSIDRVTATDGIMVTNRNLGGSFTSGLFIAHDGAGSSPTNYKLVPWQTIAADGGVLLTTDTAFDPR